MALKPHQPQAEAALNGLRTRRQPRRKANAAEADSLLWLCRAHGLPMPEREIRFHPTRMWRADYIWRDHKVILEREGGLFRGGKGGGSAKGGHTSGVGVLRDIEKANAAQLLGYVYLRATPRQIQRAEILPTLQVALAQGAVIRQQQDGRPPWDLGAVQCWEIR